MHCHISEESTDGREEQGYRFRDIDSTISAFRSAKTMDSFTCFVSAWLNIGAQDGYKKVSKTWQNIAPEQLLYDF